MAAPRFSVSALIPAAPQDVYALLADYHHGHPRILPRPPFASLVVEQGGTGAGTVMRVHMRVLGRRQTFRAVVTEPEPGRVLVETNDNGSVTTFTVDPRAAGQQASVTIATALSGRTGLVGALERWVVPRLLRPVYGKELAQLAAVAAEGDGGYAADQNTARRDLSGMATHPLYEGAARIHIAAPPAVVYDLVADITRMGAYSPECRRCQWLGGARGPAVGARFRGDNAWGLTRWSRTCEVVVADRGREFAFRTLPTGLYRDSTRWRYRVQPAGEGQTLLTESYALTEAWLPIRLYEVLTRRPQAMPRNMEQTLVRLKAVAEGRSAQA